MNSRVVGLRIASAVFGLVVVGQLVRLIARVKVNVGSCAVPLWCSGLALVIAAALAIWLWKLSLTPAEKTPAAT